MVHDELACALWQRKMRMEMVKCDLVCVRALCAVYSFLFMQPLFVCHGVNSLLCVAFGSIYTPIKHEFTLFHGEHSTVGGIEINAVM